MSQQRLSESSKETKQRIARTTSRSASPQSFQGGSHPILQLQRTLGNRQVAQLIQANRLTPQGKIAGLQPKLTVGAANDPYEQEADQVAREVLHMPDAAAANSIHPQTAGPESVSFAAEASVEDRVSQSKGRGSPLPDSVRDYMEPRFGTDFSHVRVHTGDEALQMNQSVRAQAFTHGSDIYFGAGSSPTNLELTAHELTHVMQQTGGALIQTKKKDTAFVGGEEGTALEGPDDTTWVEPGKGGYGLTMEGATGQFAGDFKELVASASMKTVSPKLEKIDQAGIIAAHDRNWYKEQESGFAGPTTNKVWQDKYNYADKKAEEYAKDKQAEQANFQSYNSFVPMANAVVQQIARVEAQKMMLGIKDDAAMTTALVKGLHDARQFGHRSKIAYAQKKTNEPIKAPTATGSVESAANNARTAAAELNGNYMQFQGAVLIDQDSAKIKDMGKEQETRLAEINEVKEFLKNVGKTIDVAHETIKDAPEKIAGYVDKPSSMIPDAEKIGEVVGDLAYYAEVKKITSVLDALKGMIEKNNLVKEFAKVHGTMELYRASLMKFAQTGVDLQKTLIQRRQDYLDLGTSMDRFAQSDPESRKEGLAPAAGGDRYATMMALVAEVREAVALAKLAKNGMPPIEGGPKSGSKAEAWQVWANGLIESRNSYASWHPNPTHFEMPEDEKAALEEVWRHLGKSDNLSNETIKRYSPVDASAGELMAALGGEKPV